MIFTVQIMLRFLFFTENISMADFLGFVFDPTLGSKYGHLILKFQVFDTRLQKIICSFFLTSDDSYFYAAIHY